MPNTITSKNSPANSQNSTQNSSAKLNWTKYTMIARLINEVKRFSVVVYNFSVVKCIAELIQSAEKWTNADVCYEIAILRENEPEERYLFSFTLSLTFPPHSPPSSTPLPPFLIPGIYPFFF